jgi:hypothetical protein
MTATTKQLLIALILLSVAGCGASVELSQTEQDAIDVLGALGGTFHDEENPGNRIDLSHSVVVVDSDLELLNEFPHMTELRLDETQITDAGLEYLKGLTNLRVLRLDGTLITGAGLEYLKGLT